MKRLICFALILAGMLGCLSLTAGAQLYSGKALDADYILNHESGGDFDDNDDLEEAYELAKFYQIQYELDTDSGVMRIFPGSRGDQKMLPYARATWIPWLKATQPNVMRPYIQKVIIEEGVLSVGRYSFYQCENLREVYLPSSIAKIDRTVFYEVPALETVYYAGNKEDFQRKVVFDGVRNERMMGKIHYGESVRISNKNQHGEIIETYTVGGYFAGDSYTVQARIYGEAITLNADQQTTVSGTFLENDATEIVFNYQCNHSYHVDDPNAPCKSKCIYCGHMNPDVYDAHTFETQQEESGGLFKPVKMSRKCTVCDFSESFEEPARILYVALALSGVIVVVGVFLAIWLPIRRKKKIRDMTW